MTLDVERGIHDWAVEPREQRRRQTFLTAACRTLDTENSGCDTREGKRRKLWLQPDIAGVGVYELAAREQTQSRQPMSQKY